MGVEIVLLLLITGTYFPEVDTNSWSFIAYSIPFICIIIPFNIFLCFWFYAKLFIRKKGKAKALEYLFPEETRSFLRCLRRVGLWSLGISNGPDAR
jgi:hypothetical protein